jgi:hypothetical protein
MLYVVLIYYADLGIPCTLCALFLLNSKSPNARKGKRQKERNNNKKIKIKKETRRKEKKNRTKKNKLSTSHI